MIFSMAAALLMMTAAGCGNNQQSGRASTPESAQRAGSRVSGGRALPPPGEPLLGSKPPMPPPRNVPSPEGYSVGTFVQDLVVPWDMAFVSRDRAYITERPGRVRLVLNGRLQSRVYANISAAAAGEGGLMGIALHPDYPNPRWVYVMYTYRDSDGLHDRISRFSDTGSTLTNETTLVERIPAATYHNGGALRFGPDGMLYAGTGDAGNPESAQDLNSLSGKILRMTPEGERPRDNPFPESLIYAYGFRNVQGLAWNPENGDLWATNHGPTGEFGLRARDSVYIVRKGGNHGWPRVLGVTDVRGVVDPILYYENTAVPPALATFYDGDLMPHLKGNFFFASLRGEHLQRVVLSGPRSVSRIEQWFATGEHEGRYGRLRAVIQGPDGALYVSTSNRDGRAAAKPGDDRILRIAPR